MTYITRETQRRHALMLGLVQAHDKIQIPCAGKLAAALEDPNAPK